MIPLIPTLISAFINTKVGQTKVPGFAQNIGEFTTSKTNNIATGVMGYGIYMLTQDSSSVMGHSYIVLSLLSWTLKDAITKK